MEHCWIDTGHNVPSTHWWLAAYIISRFVGHPFARNVQRLVSGGRYFRSYNHHGGGGGVLYASLHSLKHASSQREEKQRTCYWNWSYLSVATRFNVNPSSHCSCTLMLMLSPKHEDQNQRNYSLQVKLLGETWWYAHSCGLLHTPIFQSSQICTVVNSFGDLFVRGVMNA